jgi:D-3-phosphoglycerate dehydrogenase
MQRILVTSTAFLDVSGEHNDLLENAGFDVVRVNGPLSETELISLFENNTGFDGLICGEESISHAVLAASQPRLRVICQYNTGIDRISHHAASFFKIKVVKTPALSHSALAEHVFALLLGLSRHVVDGYNYLRNGQCKILTGSELAGKRLGLIGLGHSGREVARRAHAFGLKISAYDNFWDASFARDHHIAQDTSLTHLLQTSDIISLHLDYTPQSSRMLNAKTLQHLKRGSILINCAHSDLIERDAVVDALYSGQLQGYGTDCIESTDLTPDNPLLTAPNCLITPRIATRTYETIRRQAATVARNMVEALATKPAPAKVPAFMSFAALF